DADRERAKRRLENEGGDDSPTGPKMITNIPPIGAAAAGGASMGGAAVVCDAGVSAQILAAQDKVAKLDGSKKAKFEELIGKLKSAHVRGDRAETARIDQELTNFLF